MGSKFLIEKETRNGVKLVAQPSEDGTLVLSFLNSDGTESSLKVTNRDANAYLKQHSLNEYNLRYTGTSFKLVT